MRVIKKYRELADACLQKAISAASVELAAGWLQMAGSWMAMAQLRQRILARNTAITEDRRIGGIAARVDAGSTTG